MIVKPGDDTPINFPFQLAYVARAISEGEDGDPYILAHYYAPVSKPTKWPSEGPNFFGTWVIGSEPRVHIVRLPFRTDLPPFPSPSLSPVSLALSVSLFLSLKL